ncbi:hypothetical protein D2E25_0280 [Bifidobacterium goeldii]|uniref:Uncharacterized protein n=1 Tax=Bifidobacterium goeldii TaxID=2306975 RepID=A0A430FM41_9BIFI|nr:hypothetical protein [Bifidobacterium goeldii]RSX53974.1 hypothetical protein D2E25_0280 [Bifidobacterium goeldii]
MSVYECGHIAAGGYHDVNHCLLLQEVKKAENLNNPARLVRIGRSHGLTPSQTMKLAKEA